MNKKILRKIIMLIITVMIIGLVYFILLNSLIKIEFNGNKEIDVEYNQVYNDEGVMVYFVDKKINPKIEINNNIDYEKIGKYYIEYKFKYLGISKSKKRIINIIDNKAPEIKLLGANPVNLSLGNEYKEPGYDVSDNYDTELKVEVSGIDRLNNQKKGEYEIVYKVIDSSNNSTTIKRKVVVQDRIIVKNGITYVDGILIVNKKYSLPKTYGIGVDKEALSQLKELQQAAKKDGYTINLLSSYRTYNHQSNLYNNYVKQYGQALADTFSAKPGHSEHQTGLAFDVGKIDDDYGETKAGIWLSKNAHIYGFIIRYPKGKEKITGYQYEPWHIRYLGKDIANKVYQSGLCLEEYLKV